jgi:hypothetical protein
MSIIVHHHLGLGDHFICNGLVNSLCNVYDKIYLACKKHYYPTVKYLYQENSQVEVFEIAQEPQDIFAFSSANSLPILHVGFQHCDIQNFESSFYQQLGYDPGVQYSAFRMPAITFNGNCMLEQWQTSIGHDYIFVHDQSSVQKFPLHIESTLAKYVVEKSQTNNVLDYVPLMLNAKEVHVINSSIQALVWPLLMQGYFKKTEIFFHDFSKVYQNQSIPIKVPQHPLVKIINYST